jgi:hypothetical protein
MNDNGVCDFILIPVEESLDNIGADFCFGGDREVGNDMKERLESEYVTHIFDLLQDLREEVTERDKNRSLHVFYIVKQFTESLEDQRVEPVLLVPRQILEDDVGQRAQHVQQQL